MKAPSTNRLFVLEIGSHKEPENQSAYVDVILNVFRGPKVTVLLLAVVVCLLYGCFKFSIMFLPKSATDSTRGLKAAPKLRTRGEKSHHLCLVSETALACWLV